MDFYSENLLEETRVFISKAMDIYSGVKDKQIKYFSELDKRILALLAASFLVEGELKDIISKFDDLSYEKVLQFMEIKEDEIKEYDGDYKAFYDEFFKADLEAMEINNESKKMYKKTPMVIFSYFGSIHVIGSDILNYFADYCKFESIFCDHPVFKEIEEKIKFNHTLDENSSSDKYSELTNRWGNLYSKLDGSPEKEHEKTTSNSRQSHFSFGIEFEKDDEQKNKIDEKERQRLDELAYFESDDIWEILDDIMAKFVGQEQAVEDIFYNIVNNQRMILNGDLQDGERSIIFVDGPTGTGKTAIIREITNRLNIPFRLTSSTKFTPAGYVGDNIESTLEQLLQKTGRDMEKAERGIIAFDEFDKLVYNPNEGNGLELKKAVQQQLLDFMGGGTYKVPLVKTLFGSIEGDFDTSKLTFICLGALTNLRENKGALDKSMGFNSNVLEKKKEVYDITPEDLIDLGYERELVGRLNTYLHTEEYSKEDLLRILKESSISPMKGFIKWFNSYNKKLVIEDGVYEAIADYAYKLNTGARSLQTIINNLRTSFMKQVMRSKDDTIYLDVETVNQVYEKSITRKSRR